MVNSTGVLCRHPKAQIRQDTRYEPPQTPTQMRLAAIWREVLRLERVGRQDDFFASGGHSLLALQVVARVRDVFRLELPLKTLFDAPTLESLSARIDQALASGAAARQSDEIVHLNWDGRPAPLSYSQERMWLIQTINPANTAYNMGAALRIRGKVDVAALSASFDELCARARDPAVTDPAARRSAAPGDRAMDCWHPGPFTI